MNAEYNVIAGLDIGNGYVKGKALVDGQEINIDFKSSVALETNSSGVKSKGKDIEADIHDIFDVMEASFDTPAVSSRTGRLFGQRGVHSGKATEEFDVASTVSKAQQDLSAILALGSIAGAALQRYFAEYKALPEDTLKVKAFMALALPITEYKRYRKMYMDRFRGISHMVSVHNFEKPVRIEILVTDGVVLAEGASAQYAITQYGEPVMEMMLKDLREHGVKLDGITANDILSAQNTIGIDIGEGTVNFPVFQDGKFNADASITFQKGYGTILEQARERLQSDGISFSSRKALEDFLNSEPRALTAARRSLVERYVLEETEGFVQELGLQFRKVIARVGAYTEVVYVYGGGACKVKNQLYPALLEQAKLFGGNDVTYPILYLDSRIPDI